MKLTLDVSFTAAWILSDEKNPLSLEILQKILDGDAELIQPELWWVETLNLLKTATLRKRIDSKTASQAVRFLKEIPIQIRPLSQLTPESVLDLALEWNLTAYDATYLATTLDENTTLGTRDKDLLSLKDKIPQIRFLDL